MSSDVPDAPEIKDQPGPWDERLAYAIVGLPFIAMGLLIIGYLVGIVMGVVPAPSHGFWADVYAEIGMTVVYAAAVLLGATYLLAVMKVFGAKPVRWLAARIRGAAAGYQPQLQEDPDE